MGGRASFEPLAASSSACWFEILRFSIEAFGVTSPEPALLRGPKVLERASDFGSVLGFEGGFSGAFGYLNGLTLR